MGDTSPIKQIEKSVDDLGGIKRRKPWLYYLIVALGGLYILVTFWAIPSLQKENTKLKDENAEMKRERDSKMVQHAQEVQGLRSERDAAKTQLAPFLAVANKQFQDPSETERLNKLLVLVEDLTVRMKAVSESLPKQRKLEGSATDRLVEALKLAKDVEADISAESGHREASLLAIQLKSVLEKGGWKVTLIYPMTIAQGELPPFEITIPRALPNEAQSAIGELLDALHMPRAVALSTNLPSNKIGIYVGPQ